MKLALAAVFAVALLALAAGCPPSPLPPSPDASDGSANVPDVFAPPAPADASTALEDSGSGLAAQACANMRALKCDEGWEPSCVDSLSKTTLRVNLACIAAARDVATLRASCNVRCLPPK